ENRLRFVFETLTRIRDSVGSDLALGLRLIGDEMIIGGLDNEALAEIAQRLEKTGHIDFLDIDIGNYHTWPLNSAPMYIAPSHQVEYVAGIKQAVSRIPVLGCVGRLTDLLEASKFIEEGKMDMIGGARGFIAEPELV